MGKTTELLFKKPTPEQIKRRRKLALIIVGTCWLLVGVVFFIHMILPNNSEPDSTLPLTVEKPTIIESETQPEVKPVVNKYKYICSDGSKVDVPSLCITKNQAENEEQPQIVKKYGLLVSGRSGDEWHYNAFRDASLWMYRVFINNLGYAPHKVYFLFEDTSLEGVDSEATKENIIEAVRNIAKRALPQDTVTLFFIGHGGIDSYDASDTGLPADELAEEVDKIKAERIIIIMSPCNSGGFIPYLSKEGRVIVVSTLPGEGNKVQFGERVIESLEKNKSLAEAYLHAINWVDAEYAKKNSPLTEHAQLDDNGDGIGHYGSLPNGGDGELAAQTYA